MKPVVMVLQMELMNHLVFHRCLLKTRRDVYVTAKRVCYVCYSWYVEISHQIQVLNPAHPQRDLPEKEDLKFYIKT